jgi:hypothetical protein
LRYNLGPRIDGSTIAYRYDPAGNRTERIVTVPDSDFDGDGIPDSEDSDDDNDGIADWADTSPFDAADGLAPIALSQSASPAGAEWGRRVR